MSEVLIRQGIVTRVAAVTNSGRVYSYERFCTDWSAFLNLFKVEIGGVQQIRGWEIFRRSTSEEKVTIGMGHDENVRKHTYQLNGYLGLDDSAATGPVMDALVESICAAFRDDYTLGGLAYDHGLLQVERLDVRMFGSVLCNCAQLSLTVEEHL